MIERPRWAVLVAQESGGRLDPAQVIAGRRAAIAVLPAVMLVVVGWVAGLVVLILGLAAPPLVTATLERRRNAGRDRQLAGALERIAASVRAGASVASGIEELVPELPEPLGEELASVARSVTLGVPVSTAVDAWVERAASRDVALAGAALSLGAQAGGPVARALDNVAATLRERRQLEAEVRALATQARASAWLLAVAPVVFAGLMATVEPRALAFLVSSPGGLVCLGAGIGLDVFGALWMARLVGRAP